LRILTLGCGHIGSVIAQDVATALPWVDVTISDSQRERAEAIASTLGADNVHAMALDVADRRALTTVLADFDLAVGLTPGRAGYGAMAAAIHAGVDMVDLSYMPQNPLTLDEAAVNAGVCVVPDCGVAPGLSNLLVGQAVSLLDAVRDVYILVGGLPQTPIPPLGYKVTWCVEDLVEEYVREVSIVQDGRRVTVQALDGVETVVFPGMGRLEAFYTDGVRTLHHTVPGVNNLWEKTLRYPGHVDQIKLLMSLGFFSTLPVTVGADTVAPRDLTTVLLEQRLSLPTVQDVVAMSIEVTGTQQGEPTRHTYRLLDHYDAAVGVSAMARTTAYTASTVIQLLVNGVITVKGVVPPERLGMAGGVFHAVMAELAKKGIHVTHEEHYDGVPT
jgi:lysine 6-dehydrogenase